MPKPSSVKLTLWPEGALNSALLHGGRSSPESQICEEFRPLPGEVFEFGQHRLEMIVHGRRRGLAVACRDGLGDGFVLGQRHVQAAARVEHAAHAVEAEPCRLGGVAHPLEAELVLQHGVEGEIEVVEALEVCASMAACW